MLGAGQIGLPQVVTSAAIAGLSEEVPLSGSDDAGTFVTQLDSLLADTTLATQQVDAFQQHLARHLTPEVVAPELRRVIEQVPVNSLPVS